jgi:hypothetical protein
MNVHARVSPSHNLSPAMARLGWDRGTPNLPPLHFWWRCARFIFIFILPPVDVEDDEEDDQGCFIRCLQAYRQQGLEAFDEALPWI